MELKLKALSHSKLRLSLQLPDHLARGVGAASGEAKEILTAALHASRTSLSTVGAWLAARPEVHFIAVSSLRKKANNGAVKQIIQTQGALFNYADSMGSQQDFQALPTSPITVGTASTPVIDEDVDGDGNFRNDGIPGLEFVGLMGSGEIVSVGDTGLDYTTCFFNDADGNTVRAFEDPNEVGIVVGDVDASSAVDPYDAFSAQAHRKVLGYWTLMDQSD